MLIYEKDNKLNISFENNMKETDIEIGKDEVKIGEATISENNVLPVPEEGDVGKVPTVQSDGSYGLENGGGSGGGVLVVTETNGTLDKTMGEIQAAFLRNDRIELQGNSGGGVTHSIAVHLREVHFDDRGGEYDAGVSFAMVDTIVSYFISEASEPAALAAYPSRS